MTPPLPWKLESAEVRIAGSIVSVSVHGMNIPTELTGALPGAIWNLLGTRPGQATVTISGRVEGVSVELIRGGIRVRIGPYRFDRRMFEAGWKEVERRELWEREKQVAYA